MEGIVTAETPQESLTRRVTRWIEEGQSLVGLLEELLDENAQLRLRAAALERDLEQFHQEKPEPPQAPEEAPQPELAEVIATGGLDMASIPRLNLSEHLQAGRTKIVLDLEGVDYIDSAALGELVRAMKRARMIGGDLRLCGLRGNVRRIFDITGLDKAIAIYPTRDEARASWE